MSHNLGIAVVGGVYGESIRSPRSYELYGSGGRAAAVLGSLKCNATLTTALDPEARKLFEPTAAAFNFRLKAIDILTTIEFIYDHPLGPPRTRPIRIEALPPSALREEADNALVFGMLEGDPQVAARRVIYDPQNPLSPKWFEDTGSSAEEIIYTLNMREGSILTGEHSPEEIVRSIVQRPNVKACALKLGPRGALIGDSQQSLSHVPCYRTHQVRPVGSGDIFAALLAWGIFTQGLTPTQAGEAASKGVALYSNSGAIPSNGNLLLGVTEFPFAQIKSKQPSQHLIYLAGPFFTLQDRWLIEETRDVLHGFGLKVFSPVHDVGEGAAEVVAPQDLEALRGSSLVLALLEGLDPGTLFEIGFARALNIPVIAHVGGAQPTHLKMIDGSNCALETDYTTSLYRTAWDTLEQ
jgi:hypothetical protein